MSNEQTDLITELINLSTSCQEPIDSEYRKAFLGNNKSRIQEIGERLHKLGGHHLMVFAWQSVPKYDQLELTHAWDGVGIWKV